MSWMIVELANDKRHELSSTERVKGPQTIECSCPSQLYIICHQAMLDREQDRAHVFRGSREEKESISIHYICYLERTRLRYPCDEHDTRCCGSWRDLVGRAIYEDPVVIDSL